MRKKRIILDPRIETIVRCEDGTITHQGSCPEDQVTEGNETNELATTNLTP